MLAACQVLPVALRTRREVVDVECVASRITVAMITKNEARAVGKVISDIKAAVPKAEILIVDSSSDRTAEIAQSLGARVLRQFPPRGYGSAIDTALRMSAREVIVTLDCDDTYPVEFIEPMARIILEDGYDLVDGSRLNGKPAAMPWINFLANWTFALLASLLFRCRLRDLHSGMRTYRRSLIDKLHYSAEGAALPVELLLRTIRDGYKVKVITIPYRPRIGESPMLPFQSAWWTLKRIFLSRFA
jgi:glycosyltransferase involved in cell wall biosynthesis